MSDTTGWTKLSNVCYEKVIGDRPFLCVEWYGVWWLRICTGSVELATRPTLRECQLLAHATARLWAGEKE
jgi:hypothetical protein